MECCNTQEMQSKVHPRIGHENTEGEQKYSSTLQLTSALDGSGWSTPRPGQFSPGKEIRYPSYRRLGLEGCGNNAPTGVRFPDRPPRSESPTKACKKNYKFGILHGCYKIYFRCSVQYVKTDRQKTDVVGIHAAFGVLLTVSVLCMKIDIGPEHCSLYLGVHGKYLFHWRCVGFRESS